LRRKLLRDITDARRIFVFKSASPGFGLAEMRRLHAAMRAIGPASLLCVTQNDRAEACRVEMLADGLYAGRLEDLSFPSGRSMNGRHCVPRRSSCTTGRTEHKPANNI